MSIEKVKEYLKKFDIAENVIEFDSSSATVELAAKAVGTDESRIAKTLGFITKEGPILIVTSGDAKINNREYKSKFGTKAKMIPRDEIELIIGHQAGGVCPFAINEDVKVYLDESMKRFNTIFPAAGSSNSAIEMTCEELEKYSQNFVKWVNVCTLI
ncbi:YbaK/EbsC family protein [Peptostreptococcus faecalis]|uniref:YbaK/EbsC family protein n=1 Tax=Peptostreptococcus faecalis TaxID=2045015 RepID=UPI000C7CBA22|nr:YbaK/EbsC family protein [Peptostreptococcus faecalis]